jgi:hypothetical protein
MSGASPPPPRGLIGFLDGLREGQVVVGWAADPQDRAARPILRLMRGLEVLAECRADVARDDGNPGFHLHAPAPLAPQDILEGRVRVRALLPGRQAATTLAMTRRMREVLEAAAGWEPTTLDPAPAPPPPAAPKVATPPSPRVFEAAPPRVSEAAPPRVPEAAPPRISEAAPPRAPEAPHVPEGTSQWVPETAPPQVPARPPAPSHQDPVLADPTPPAARPAPEPARHGTPVPAAPGWTPAPTPAPAAPAAEMPSSWPAGPAASRPAADTATAAPPESPAPIASRPAPPVPEAMPPPPPPLDAFLALARVATAAGVPVLHLLVPRRATVLADEASPAWEQPAWEQAAAARPMLAADWVPLRQAFAHQPNAGGYWREDGRSLSIDGCHALLLTLLKVLQARLPEAAGALARAASLAQRADLAALPRRDIAPEPGAPAGPSFLGVAMRETEPDLSEAIFSDRPAPRLIGEVMPGLEAWSAPAAPLPWRVVVLAAPGLGGSAGPARLGWWLRWLVAECVLSEALHIAAPEAALGPQPDLVLTLAPEP